jgi:hypothetical protein
MIVFPAGLLLHSGKRLDGVLAGSVRATVLCVLALLFAVPSSPAFADESPALTVGGLLFGDAYYVASHHTEEGDGAAGLVLRRGYLTFDADAGSTWFGRLRFEVNQSGEFETYDFDADVKDLYVGWKPGRHRIIVGLSATPTFDLIESIWGLRYLERTPMDLQGVASRDTGISASGPLNASGTLGYRAMVGTGIELGSDSNDSTKWMGAMTWRPSEAWAVDLYADFEDRRETVDRWTVQLFAGYQSESLRWGAQYANQDRKDDPPLELASAFVTGRIRENVWLVGRVDRLMEPSPKGDAISYLPYDPIARATTFMAALEFRVGPHVRITPNTVVTTYDRNDQGIRPEADVHLRLTFFIDFE